MPLYKKLVRESLPILALLAANLLVFHEYWTAERLFTGKDLLTAFGPLLNFQTDCLQAWSLPLWNPFMNFGYPFVEHYSNTMFFPTHLLMGLVTGSTLELIQRELLFWLFLGGLGTYLCARELGRSRSAATAAGMAYMFCGQVVALPTWHLLVYNAACFPYLLLGYHRARRTGTSLSFAAILFLAFSILGGHITTTVLGAYLFAAYVLADSLLRRQGVSGLKFLLLTFVAAGLLSAPKLAPLFEAMKLGPRMLAPESLHTKDPQNVVNFYHFMSYLLPVKYFYSLYLGELAVLAAAFAVFRRKLRPDALLVLFALSAWLLMVDSRGDVSLLRLAANVLPLMKLVRNEWFEWFYPSLFAVLFFSGEVDRFLSEPFGKAHLATGALFAALLTVCFLGAYNTAAFAGAFAIHFVLAACFLALPLLRERGSLQFAALAGLTALEFFVVFARVAPDEPPLRDATRIRVALIDQGSIGKTYRDDNQVRAKFYATAVQDRFRPPVAESAKQPFLISGLSGAPTYNLFPEQYANFIDFMNLKRFSGWWYNAQERFDFIQLKDSPLLAQMDGAPLFALFNSATGVPYNTPTARLDAISCSQFDFTVQAPGPSFLLLHQMFDERWGVRIDGGPRQPPERANQYFMSVAVGPGQHTVRFEFADPVFTGGMGVSALTLGGLGVLALRRTRARRREEAHDV